MDNFMNPSINSMEKTEGEIFWEIVETLEKKGHRREMAMKAAHVLTDKQVGRKRKCPNCKGTGTI